MTAATAKKPPKVDTPVVQYALVGFTPTCVEALPLLDDPAWSVAGMNNLHTQEPFKAVVSKFDEWFDIHETAEIRKDEVHTAWLASGANGVPVWTWDPQPDWPTSIAYPRSEITAQFGHYFTNTVSWQLALFLRRIMEHAGPDGRAPEGSKIAVYGIDMATGGEYSAQRPSCEYFLGIAAGLGVELLIPERSDLLKTAQLYGERDSGLRAKLAERREILTQQLQHHESNAAQHQAAAHQARGALESLKYIEGVWIMPTVDRPSVSQDGASPT